MFNNLLASLNDFLYSYILIFLLVAAGIYFSIRTKFVQFRLIGDAIKALKEKAEQGEELTKADLVPLLLTPLMSGSLRIEERIIKSLSIIQKAGKVLTELELNKMQAVLYTLADKFLTETELGRVKEMIAMTKLGEMLVEDGIKRGIERGLEERMEKGIEKGIVYNVPIDVDTLRRRVP